MILTKKRFIFLAVVLTVVLIISILFVMLWHGCFRSYDFRLNINSNEIYRMRAYGRGEITCRSEIQRIVRRLNSYRLTYIEPGEGISLGETPLGALYLYDENGYLKWLFVMRGIKQVQIARTPVDSDVLPDWYRIRGLRGWFAAG